MTFDLIIRIWAVALDHTKTRSQHLKLFPQDCVSTVDKQTHTCNHPLFTSRQKQPVCYPVIMDVHMLNRSDNYSCVCVCCCLRCYVFLLVVEVIWKECSGRGGPSQPLNQQAWASNESAALPRAMLTEAPPSMLSQTHTQSEYSYYSQLRQKNITKTLKGTHAPLLTV